MNRIIRFYNQNRKKIWQIIIIIAVILFIIQILNYLKKTKIDDGDNSYLENTSNSVSVIENTAVVSDKSAVSGATISETVLKTASDTIAKFIDDCNNQKPDEAYNLLSDDCKSELYPTLEDFVNSYYKDNFTSKKSYDIENWNASIYKVRYYEDLLSTGKSVTEQAIQDYITLVKLEDNEYKLNINSYIGKTEIGKEQMINDIRVKVVAKQRYMEYESYMIEVENKTDKTIWLDTGKSSKSMYLEDTKDMRYLVYSHQISYDALKVKPGQIKKYKVKFIAQYSSDRSMKNLVFSDLILDYDEYVSIENKEDYSNKIVFSIGIK